MIGEMELKPQNMILKKPNNIKCCRGGTTEAPSQWSECGTGQQETIWKHPIKLKKCTYNPGTPLQAVCRESNTLLFTPARF